MTQKSEEKLLEEFTNLYNPFRQKLFNYIKFIVNNYALASDILQETLIRAYKSFTKLREKSRFENWVFRIAKNEISRMMSKLPKYEVLVDEIYSDYTDTLIGSTHNDDDFDKIISAMDNEQRTDYLLSHLSESERELIEEIYYAQKSFSEIAAETNSKIGTVRVSHHRIMKKLWLVSKTEELEEKLNLLSDEELVTLLKEKLSNNERRIAIEVFMNKRTFQQLEDIIRADAESIRAAYFRLLKKLYDTMGDDHEKN